MNGNEVLKYDSDVRRRMLISGTNQRLSNAAYWFADGTFEVLPTQFAKLYTVHGLSDGGRNIVGFLLPDKRGETCMEFISQVQGLPVVPFPQP